MANIFRIHPGIGIARVGNAASAFFVGPELPGSPGFELDANGTDAGAVTALKDSAHRIKRQAARFSVWAYLRDDVTLKETLVGEVQQAQARIEWKVQFANTKASGVKIWSDASPRNADQTQASLSITPTYPSISGANKIAAPTTPGMYKNTTVSLGELRTDAAGRLLVLGGSGLSASPSNAPITNFANNRDWFDDVADGPVDAVLHFADGTQVGVDKGAWVIIAPPDFAPPIAGIITLYDVALDAAIHRGFLPQPAQPSYREHILPILERTTNLRFVNRFPVWNGFPRDFVLMGTTGTAAADDARAVMHALLIDVEESEVLDDFKYTGFQRAALDKWLAGNFAQDLANPVPVAVRSPASIDRAALERAVGGGFFPGIEMGIMCTNPQLYDEPFRLTRAQFQDSDLSVNANGVTTLRAGSISERMACPWKADFLKCQGNWWPAQRPDRVMTRANDAQPGAVWDEGISSHQDLVTNFWKLGFLKAATASSGENVFVESERDGSLPPR